jgi:hypothetical protein
MIRRIQFAAQIGMGLALFQFVWVLVRTGDHVDFDTLHKWRDFREGVHDLLSALSQPSNWFCWAAMVYLFAEHVRIKSKESHPS